MQIDFLPCESDDTEFVLCVTEVTMRGYVEEAFGSWDADVQRRQKRGADAPSMSAGPPRVTTATAHAEIEAGIGWC